MRKKVLSLTLVAAMMAGCLAGCGNADSKDEGTTAAAGDSTTDQMSLPSETLSQVESPLIWMSLLHLLPPVSDI